MSKQEVLLVVDLQKEFKDKEGNYDRLLEYVRCAGAKYDSVIGTVCMNTPDSNFVRYGNWYDCMGYFIGLEYTPDITIVKHGYGLDDYNILSKDKHYYIMGMNTDACVLKVALDLFDKGYEFTVLGDYCASNGGLDHHVRGISLMQTLFPEAIVSTMEFDGHTKALYYVPNGVTVKTPEIEKWFDNSKSNNKQVVKKEITSKNKGSKQKKIKSAEKEGNDNTTALEIAEFLSKLFGATVRYEDGAFIAEGEVPLKIDVKIKEDEDEQIDFGHSFRGKMDGQALKDLFGE